MKDPAAHRTLREALGAYVLGHLAPDESAAIEAHLASCPTCPAELAELRPAAAALASVRQLSPVAASLPSPDLAARIDQRIDFEERRNSRSRTVRSASMAMLGAAAAAVVLVVGLRVTAPDAPVVAAVPLEAVSFSEQQPGVTASANLVDHTWGVEVKLVAAGLTAGAQYSVTLTDAGGTAYPAGAFVGTGVKPVKCNLNAGVLRKQATGFVVRDVAGAVVLKSDFGT